jgi:hypothetical protein
MHFIDPGLSNFQYFEAVGVSLSGIILALQQHQGQQSCCNIKRTIEDTENFLLRLLLAK